MKRAVPCPDEGSSFQARLSHQTETWTVMVKKVFLDKWVLLKYYFWFVILPSLLFICSYVE
ncbi:hypothetical protein DsansV1_C01g0001881 [Dioscorea sansibarensis]